MISTKLFKNGNSQAVRIPAELAYSSWDIELVIERQGDELNSSCPTSHGRRAGQARPVFPRLHERRPGPQHRR